MRDRIKAMEAISRIRDHELQGKSADLTRMQNDLGRIREIRDDLRASRLEACGIGTVETMSYLTRFLRNVAVEEARADQAEATMSKMIDTKREEVMEAWRGVRSIDRLREAAVLQMTKIESRIEAAVSDERSLISYTRSRRPAC